MYDIIKGPYNESHNQRTKSVTISELKDASAIADGNLRNLRRYL